MENTRLGPASGLVPITERDDLPALIGSLVRASEKERLKDLSVECLEHVEQRGALVPAAGSRDFWLMTVEGLARTSDWHYVIEGELNAVAAMCQTIIAAGQIPLTWEHALAHAPGSETAFLAAQAQAAIEAAKTDPEEAFAAWLMTLLPPTPPADTPSAASEDIPTTAPPGASLDQLDVDQSLH